MPQPDVTVLMPVYNGAAYLRPAIDSVLNQTYPHFRLLVVDDASTDDSREIVRAYTDPRIDLLALAPNGGQVAAMNRGLEAITTPFVARLDADDTAVPERLEWQMDFLRQHPDVVLLGGWVRFMDQHGRNLGVVRLPVTHQEIVDGFTRGNPFNHSAITYRLDVARRLGGYPTDYDFGEDFAFWWQFIQQGRGANLPVELATVRWHTRSKTATMYARRTASRLRVFHEMLAHPGLAPRLRQQTRQSIGMTMLDQATAYADSGQPREALRWRLLWLHHYAHLCLRDRRMPRRVVHLVLGRHGRAVGNVLRRALRRGYGFARL